jgi:hypothetical protein
MKAFFTFSATYFRKTAKNSTKIVKLVDGRFRGLVLKTMHQNLQKARIRGHVGIHAWNLASHSSQNLHKFYLKIDIMFTPARDFLLETPWIWMIIIPNPNVNSHSL